jgi:uncharacterized protein
LGCRNNSEVGRTSKYITITSTVAYVPNLVYKVFMAEYQIGQKVELIIDRETPLGFIAIINQEDEGLLYHNEVFEHLEPGVKVPGYIKLIRPNGEIDLLLQPLGKAGADVVGERILDVLQQNNGFLPLTSKTDTEEVYRLLGLSKKKFKFAASDLYKKGLITLDKDGIRLK